jgi:ABC-type spermidine/putrescine transport system permease subunit II
MILPIIIVIILAFGDQEYLSFPPKSFSMRWFADFFSDPRWLSALWSSLIIALVCCTVASIIGFFAAYSLVRGQIRAKKLMLSFMLLPIIVPHIITALALYYISVPLGLVGNVFWIGCAHAVIALPVVLLVLLPTLSGVDPNLERAALSLGANRLDVFMKVVMPIAIPGILSAALFAFLASFDELIIAMFLTGPRSQTVPVRIWNSLHLQVEPIIAAVSAFLIGVTGIILILNIVLRYARTARLKHGIFGSRRFFRRNYTGHEKQVGQSRYAK